VCAALLTVVQATPWIARGNGKDWLGGVSVANGIQRAFSGSVDYSPRREKEQC